jgi:hypothetical protein
MKKLVIPIFGFLSLFSTLVFGIERSFELCSTTGLIVQLSGIKPNTDFKEKLHSIPCQKIDDSNFMKIFKILSSGQVVKNEGYIGYRLLVKAGSFHIYMSDSYIVELNNIHYQITDRNDQVSLCNIVGRVHHTNMDAKTITAFCN